MCGFVGFLTLDVGACPDAVERLGRGLDFIRRRGPDSQRCSSTPDGHVHLGFARLAIVDPDESAHQPLVSPEDGLTVVMNGEIYNYSDLRRELDAYPFRTQSDTEVLLATFARWGVAGLARLRGMFAAAIVDWKNERLFLIRDPVGKKPLFVREDGQDLVFGSSVLALQAASRRPAALNDAAVREFWNHEYVLPDRSILGSCSPVMPGEVLEYDWCGRKVQTHACRPAQPPFDSVSPDDARQECHRLLSQSIVRRMHNNPRPVSLRSGGSDSTVLTQCMHQLAGGESITLTSRLRLSPDERYAKYAARRIGVPVRQVRFSLSSMAEDVNWAFSLQDEPLAMISFFMLAQLVKASKDYGKILITGDGGDEVFLGYGKPSDWTDGSATVGTPSRGTWTAGVEPPQWMSGWGRFVVREQLVGHMFTKVDRAAAEQGVETRSPLLDWDLLAFARQLPAPTLLASGRMKSLLKGELQDWPDWFIERPKVGFTFRMRWLWLLSGFAGVREMVSQSAVERFGKLVPRDLRRGPREWSTRTIFRNFKTIWKLMAWSEFERRLAKSEVRQTSSAARSVPTGTSPLVERRF